MSHRTKLAGMFGYPSSSGARAMAARLMSALALAALSVLAALPLAAQAAAPQLAAREDRVLALRADGTVWQWGSLGKPVPSQVQGLAGVVAVAVGNSHGLALLASGDVWAWGRNRYGQLGNGGQSEQSSETPTRVSGISDVIAIATTGDGSLALKRDGTVWTWGDNQSNQLGIGNASAYIALPTQIVGLEGVQQIEGGNRCGAALTNDGNVWTWGKNFSGQLGDGTIDTRSTPVRASVQGVTRLVAGDQFFFALRADGSVWAWGNNTHGQLANGGGATNSGFAPPTYNYQTLPMMVPALQGFRRIVAGGSHALGLSADGQLWSWGSNAAGQIGIGGQTTGSTSWRGAPDKMLGIPAPIDDLAAGADFSAALTSAGEIWTWGGNGSGQIGRGWKGNGAMYGVRIEGLSATQVSAGARHSLALAPDGQVFAWGDNRARQLGRQTPEQSLTPLAVPGVSGATAVAACASHSMALTAQGQVMIWGADLPNGPRREPAPMTGLSGITALACGVAHSLALDAQGQVWAWGDGNSGQLGQGTTTGSAVPLQVPGLSDVRAIAAGGLGSLALAADGQVFAWGAVSSDRASTLGAPQLTPKPVFSGATAISAGYRHAFIRGNDGAWYGWGANTDGEVGTGDKVEQPSPVRLTLPTPFGAVAAGGGNIIDSGRNYLTYSEWAQSYGLDAEGVVWQWGQVCCGAPGIGTPDYVPRLPAGVRQISGGSSHALALGATGDVWAWGGDRPLFSVVGVAPEDTSVPKPVLDEKLFTNFNVHGVAPNIWLKEYRVAQDGSYFYSALPAEQQFIDSGGLGSGWSPTGNDFKVWLGSNGPTGSYPVCRFRGDNVTVPGFGHFYTALPIECEELRNGRVPYWLYEGTGLYVYMPTTSCPAGTRPIYRQYNARLHNHHFQASNQLSAQQQADGWTMEGIPFCVGK